MLLLNATYALSNTCQQILPDLASNMSTKGAWKSALKSETAFLGLGKGHMRHPMVPALTGKHDVFTCMAWRQFWTTY